MGVILKQTVKGSFFTYLGAFLGFISTIVLQPYILANEQIGLITILITYSTILAQFSGLGFDSIANRLFPYFRDYNKKHNGFLFIAVITALIGFIIVITIFFVIKPLLLENKKVDTELLSQYIYYIIPLTFFTVFFVILDSYYRVLYNAVKGTVIKEFFQRIFIFVPLALFGFRLINFPVFVFIYTICFCLPTLMLVYSLVKEKQFSLTPKMDFITDDLKKSMLSVGAFGVFASSTAMIVTNVDRLMIQNMIGLDATGIYSTTFYFGLIITIPYRALSRISSTIVADAWKNNDMKVISDVYYKSVTIQFIVAALLFVGIWANIDNIFRILPEGRNFESGKYVIFFICIGYLIDMATGLNAVILSSSKHYRYLTYFTLILVGLTIITNFIFIPIYGIVGAAIATSLSMFITNFLRYIFLYNKFKLQPYRFTHLWIILFSSISFFAVYYIPFIHNLYLDIAVRSSIITLVFVIPIFYLKISDDVNQFAQKILRRFISM